MRTRYKNVGRMYSIGQDETQGWIIEVVIGGIALWTGHFKLTLAEVAQFKEEGHLDSLARRIAKNHEAFKDRQVHF